MSKKILSLALVFVLALGLFAFPSYAADPISVYLDDRALTFDVPPQLINNRTMVPLRAIFEAMGAKVDWDGDTETVTGTKDSTVVILAIGSTSPTINGKIVTIDQPGVIVDGRTLAPLRFVAEAFGGDVAWDGDTQTASITMGDSAPATPKPSTQTEPQTTPTTPPSDNVNHAIVGVWGTGIDTFGDWHSSITGSYMYTSGSIKGVEFRSNGTFDIMIIITGRSGSLQEFYKGNYKVEGSVIYFTNILYKMTSIDNNNNIKDSSHDYESIADQRIVFEIFDFNDTNGLCFEHDDSIVITDGVIYFGSSNLYPVE